MRALEEEAGSPTAASARAGWSYAHWTNLRRGAKDSKTGKIRGMSKGTARHIEAAFNRPTYWLDTDHDPEDVAPAALGPEFIPITRVNLKVSAGVTGFRVEPLEGAYPRYFSGPIGWRRKGTEQIGSTRYG